MTRPRLRGLRLRHRVYDSWWPYRVGRIVKVLKTLVVVRWDDGVEWRYDVAHQVFLNVIPPRQS